MKIKKNLSDADMLKGFAEAKSFETEILEDSQADNSLRRPGKVVKTGNELLLPADAQEKLNKYLHNNKLKIKLCLHQLYKTDAEEFMKNVNKNNIK